MVAALAALLCVVVAAQIAAARPDPTRIVLGSVPGRSLEVRARHTSAVTEPRRLTATSPNARTVGPQSATADIQVTYTNFPASAQAAFEAAATVWESQLVSGQVIHVNANWAPLGSNVLGSAGPTFIYLLGDGLLYPVALAEARCACNLTSTEINANFNSTFASWYFGIDGNPGSSQYDFYSVVMHELGHGLGFLGSFGVSGSNGQWGYTVNGTKYPMAYDTFEYSAATGGNQLINTGVYANPSADLKTQLTDGSVYFGGPNAVATNGGRAKLYAPSTWSGGSSNAHLDESAFPADNSTALMTPYLSNGEVHHEAGALTLAIMRDIGWETDGGPSPTPSPSPPTSAPTASPTIPPSPMPTTSATPTGTATATSTATATATPTAPIVDLSLPALTNSTTVPVTLTESDPAGTGIAAWLLSSNSANPAPGDGGWLSVKPTTFTLPGGDGSKSVYGWVKNNAGTVSQSDVATTVLDTTAPTIFLPAPRIVSPQALGTSAVTRVSWSPATDSNGVSAYHLQYKRGTQAWLPVTLSPATATSVDLSLPVGSSYRFRLSATDAAGNTSADAVTDASSLSLVQEKATSVTYTGSWKRVVLAGASSGYVKRSLSTGSKATYVFSGDAVAIVSTLGPARGIAEIRVDGTLVATVDLFASTLQTARVVWSQLVAPGGHSVEVRVKGTRNPASSSVRVDIDGFLILT